MKTETKNETHVLETMPGFERLKAMLAEMELDVLTEGLTLSQAIREGASTTNQKIGGFYDQRKNETCALSAALMSAKARGLA